MELIERFGPEFVPLGGGCPLGLVSPAHAIERRLAMVPEALVTRGAALGAARRAVQHVALPDHPDGLHG